jgi:hypothetical protein
MFLKNVSNQNICSHKVASYMMLHVYPVESYIIFGTCWHPSWICDHRNKLASFLDLWSSQQVDSLLEFVIIATSWHPSWICDHPSQQVDSLLGFVIIATGWQPSWICDHRNRLTAFLDLWSSQQFDSLLEFAISAKDAAKTNLKKFDANRLPGLDNILRQISQI